MNSIDAIAEQLFDLLCEADPKAVAQLAKTIRERDERFHNSQIQRSENPVARKLVGAILSAGEFQATLGLEEAQEQRAKAAPAPSLNPTPHEEFAALADAATVLFNQAQLRKLQSHFSLLSDEHAAISRLGDAVALAKAAVAEPSPLWRPIRGGK